MKKQSLSHFFIAAPQVDQSAESQKQTALFVFETFFQQLHDSLTQSFVSFEMFASPQNISLGFTAPTESSPIISSLLYSTLPRAEIIKTEDHLQSILKTNSFKCWANASLFYPSLIPLFLRSEEYNAPLTTLLNSLQRIAPGQKACIQLIISPIKDSLGNQLKMGSRKFFAQSSDFLEPRFWFNRDKRQERSKLSRLKASLPLFSCSLNILVTSSVSKSDCQQLLSDITSSFSAFQHDYLNRFKIKQANNLPTKALQRINVESFALTPKEAASLFHFPDESTVPSLLRVISHREPAPKAVTQMPSNEEVCLFGTTNYRSQRLKFGISRIDRRRHLYLLGKSGVGKSKLLELLIKNDIESGHGVAVLDPHGDLVDNVLRFIPENRIKDVVLFDPSDTEFPVGLNLLEQVSPELKIRVTISLIDIFKKLFGNNWSPRLEHVLRYTSLALLDTPGTTVFSILKMLTDKKFRQAIVRGIKDDVVKNFWVNEFASWSERFDSEAITPLLNKVGQFVATDLIRNIVGQSVNKFNCRQIMDERKILLVKISKGILGEENASLLGSMIVTKIYQAAMSRADIPEHERKDFYFYVDEFQNFTTNTFDEILSEARKYRLNLTIANQFLGQLEPRIKTTVFGNVGSMICMRIGGNDAAELAQEFTPRFKDRDLINLGVQEFVIKMSVNGETIESFSGRTTAISYPKQDYSAAIKAHSRKKYATPLAEVESLLNSKTSSSIQDRNHLSSSPEKTENINEIAVQIQSEEPEFEEPII